MNLENFLTDFILHLLSIAPPVFLCYLPFRDRLKRSAHKIILETGLASIVSSLLWALMYHLFGFDSSGNLHAVVFVLLCFLYYCKTVREGISKLSFVFCVAIHAGSIAGGMELIPVVLLNADDRTLGGITSLLYSSIRVAVYLIAGWTFQHWIIPRLRQVNSPDLKGMWLIPFAFSSITIYYYTAFYNTHIIDYTYPVVFSLLSVLSFFIYVMLLRMLDNAAKNARLELDVAFVNRQLDMQRTQYIQLMENVEHAKHARHDMRHQLATISQLSDEEPVKGYVESLLGSLPDVADTIYCENVAVNAVINHYMSLTSDKSISADVRLDIPENTGRVIAMDLCVLIGNLLENAVEACCRMNRGDRFIRVRSRIQAGGLSIVIENSFDGIWNEHDGVYISRKTNNAVTPRNGVGLSSVHAICDKYDGMFKAEVNNQAWKVSALLEMGG